MIILNSSLSIFRSQVEKTRRNLRFVGALLALCGVMISLTACHNRESNEALPVSSNKAFTSKKISYEPAFAQGFREPIGWAPGIINPQAGTIQLEVLFKCSSKEIEYKYSYIFDMRSSRKEDGTHALAALVFCPKHNVRRGVRQGLLWITRNSKNAGMAVAKNPDYAKNSKHVFTITWGKGKTALWADGKKLAESKFKGALGQLPNFFKLGDDRFLEVVGLNISDSLRSDKYCEAKTIRKPDANTTLSFRNGIWKNQDTEWQRETFQAFAFPVTIHADVSFYSDEVVKLPFRAVNFKGTEKPVKISLKCRDMNGKIVATEESTLKIPANTIYSPESMIIPVLGMTGYIDSEITVECGAVKKKYTYKFILMPAQFRATDGKLREMLGHHHQFHFRPNAFSKLGVRWHRHWAKSREFLWCNLEFKPGEFNWDKADFVVEQAKKRGIKQLGLLGYPPEWASTFSPAEMARVKKLSSTKWLAKPERYQPRDINEWNNYVRQVVRRYKGKVQHWEIYNEIDLHPCNGGKHGSFTGTTKDYFELLKNAYKIIHEEDPEAQLVISGFNLNPSGDRNMVFDLLKMGAAQYFDKFAIHGYVDKVFAKSVLEAAKKAKPKAKFWQTEICFLSHDSNIQQRCQNINNTFFWFLEQDVEKFFWHGGEFNHLKEVRPEFASLGMLWTALRSCEKYEGHLPSAKNYPWMKTWCFSRTDGKFLTVFSFSKGMAKLDLAFASENKQITVTDDFGKVIYSGKYDKSKFPDMSYICYILSESPFTIKSATREVRNIFENNSFEETEGDTTLSWENARPSHWVIKKYDPKSGFSIAKTAKTGKLSLNLFLSEIGKRIYALQKFDINLPGKYNFSAQVKNESKIPVNVTLRITDCGNRENTFKKKFIIEPGADFAKIELPIEWKKDSMPVGKVAAIITLLSPGGTLLVDDVVLIQKQ